MKDYHLVWLSAHPERTESWLKERLKDGFDIHHLNGDHDDNSAENLVLIDAADHMMIHNGSKRLDRGRPDHMQAYRRKQLLRIGKPAYEARKEWGDDWTEIAADLKVSVTTAKKWGEQYERQQL